MDKTIVVTGGAGFIGSHLCYELLITGNKVLCIDNLSSGREENIKLFSNNRFEFAPLDITKDIHIGEKIDEIYNLACPASPKYAHERPLETLRANTIGMMNVMELAQVETYRGNTNCTGPRACYDEGKRCAETIVLSYSRVYDMPVSIVRIFNTYGPNMRVDDGRVVSNFIVQALKGEDLTVQGDGSQTRSFCYVSDLVRGLILAMEKPGIGPVNLGNPEEVTIMELAVYIRKLVNSNSGIYTFPMPEDDPVRRKPDITKAKEMLEWEPCVNLDDGLSRTIKYFRGVL